MKIERHLELRAPFDALEDQIVKRSLKSGEDLGASLLGGLRYVVSFCRMTLVRGQDGRDVDVSGLIASHAWRVRTVLTHALMDPDAGLWNAIRELPALLATTRQLRAEVLSRLPIDRESLDAEVCEKRLVTAAGGGGGAGFGYAGVFNLLNRHGIEPALLAGTSIGALISLFRARRRQFDVAAMFEAGRRLSIGGLFKVLEPGSVYGLPATLRLRLHPTLGSLFLRDDGLSTRFSDLEIPMRVVTTGLSSEALKHETISYDHFVDDSIGPESTFGRGGWRRLVQVIQVVQDLMSQPEFLSEIVFGDDPITHEADVLDAAGFSSSIPGLIHYDVMRDDPRMLGLLDRLYMKYGITRLMEGGLVNNVPARVAYKAVMEGSIVRRNAFILAMDCFAPQTRSLLYMPLQQIVRQNVVKNIPYANLYFPLHRTLNPLNMVPALSDVEQAMRWTAEELKPHLNYIKVLCSPIPALGDSPS